MSATFQTSDKSVGQFPSLECSANFQPYVNVGQIKAAQRKCFLSILECAKTLSHATLG